MLGIRARGDDKMAISAEGLRSTQLYKKLIDAKVTEALVKLQNAFGDDIIGRSTCYDWYTKFASDVRDVSDATRCEKPPYGL